MGPLKSVIAAAFLFVASLVEPASSTIALAVSLPELVAQSEHVVLGIPRRVSCQYETIGNARRIVSDIELEIEHGYRGTAGAGSTLVVRTLGGTVGKIAQVVPGEAPLTVGAPALLFLGRGQDGLLHVSSMAQGHYPLLTGTPEAFLTASPGLDGIVWRDESAVRRLHGQSLTGFASLLSTIPSRP